MAARVGTGHIYDHAERGRSGSEGGGLAAPLALGSPTLLSPSVCPASLREGRPVLGALGPGVDLARPQLPCL